MEFYWILLTFTDFFIYEVFINIWIGNSLFVEKRKKWIKKNDNQGVEIRSLDKHHYFRVVFFLKYFFSKYIEVCRKWNFCSYLLKPIPKGNFVFSEKTLMAPDYK